MQSSLALWVCVFVCVHASQLHVNFAVRDREKRNNQIKNTNPRVEWQSCCAFSHTSHHPIPSHPLMFTSCIRNCTIQRLTIFTSLIWNLDGSAVHVRSVRKGSYSYRVYESYAWELPFYSTIHIGMCLQRNVLFSRYLPNPNESPHISVFIQNYNGLYSVSLMLFQHSLQQLPCSGP